MTAVGLRVSVKLVNARSYRLAAVIAIAGMLLVPCGRAENDREPIGYVFDSIGDWIQDGVKFPHKSGDPVYAGAVIKLDPACKDAETRGAAISINLFNGKREERSSEQPSTFNRPIELPTSLGNQSSAVTRLFRAMGALFSSEPEKYLITTVRGTDKMRLRDAVVEQENGQIDVGVVFNGARAGKYVLRFSSLDTQSAKRTAANASVSVNWQPEIGNSVPVPEVPSGLWRVEVMQNAGERSFGADAWVLVVPSAMYEKAARLFDEAITVTHSWGGNISDAEIRSFRRMALDAIAREQIR